MTKRLFIAGFGTALSLATLAQAEDVAEDRIALTAEAAMLEVAPRASGRNILTLPTLEYRFRLRAQCANGGQPVSFSLSVADSRLALREEELAEQPPGARRELRLEIPSEQLAPLALTGFCAAGDDGAPRPDDRDEVLIPSILGAQASLRCSHADSQTTTYLSTPLDIRLVCNVPSTELSAPESGPE